jgi:hypothetical protein
MNEEDSNIVFGVLLASVVWGLLMLAAVSYKNFSWRNDAIEAGCGEYFLDSANEKQWRWKNQPQMITITNVVEVMRIVK